MKNIETIQKEDKKIALRKCILVVVFILLFFLVGYLNSSNIVGGRQFYWKLI